MGNVLFAAYNLFFFVTLQRSWAAARWWSSFGSWLVGWLIERTFTLQPKGQCEVFGSITLINCRANDLLWTKRKLIKHPLQSIQLELGWKAYVGCDMMWMRLLLTKKTQRIIQKFSLIIHWTFKCCSFFYLEAVNWTIISYISRTKGFLKQVRITHLFKIRTL